VCAQALRRQRRDLSQAKRKARFRILDETQQMNEALENQFVQMQRMIISSRDMTKGKP
jgi:hypothetical protein